MTQIQLAIVRKLHQPSLAAGQRIMATRIIAKLGFWKNGSCPSIDSVAIVDTGAPLSLIPASMWRDIDRQILGSVMAGGVAEKPECKFPADLAIVHLALSDGRASLGPFRVHALLAHNDKVPALLGFADVLEHLRITIDLSRDLALLESS